MNCVKTSIAALALSTMAVPAMAQVNAGNLVNVNVSNVQVDIRDLIGDITISDNAVQVGIGVAANVCNTTVAILVADLQDDGEATCTAVTANQALAQATRNQNR